MSKWNVLSVNNTTSELISSFCLLLRVSSSLTWPSWDFALQSSSRIASKSWPCLLYKGYGYSSLISKMCSYTASTRLNNKMTTLPSIISYSTRKPLLCYISISSTCSRYCLCLSSLPWISLQSPSGPPPAPSTFQLQPCAFLLQDATLTPIWTTSHFSL